MGFWSNWSGLAMAEALPSMPAILAPQVEAWTTSQLDGLVWSDVLGVPPTIPLTRAEAMAVPAVARSRHLTVGAIGQLPLEVYRGAEQITPTPGWAVATDGQLGQLTAERRAQLGLHSGQSPWWRLLWTVDDLLFYGYSVWLVTWWDADHRLPLRMARLPWASWSVDDRGRIVDADGHPFGDDIRVITGPHEGLLTFAARTIRAAATLEASAQDIARRPFRLELHQTSDVTLTQAEKTALVNATRTALADNNGVLFTNSAVETKDHPIDSGDLLIDARNASAVDIARMVSIPAAMIDATNAGASLTYETTEGRGQQWLDLSLILYTRALESRLSMDDVVAQGQRVALNTEALTLSTVDPTGPNLED